MDGVGTPIIGRPRPLPSHDTPNPAHNTYTLKCEEPVMEEQHADDGGDFQDSVGPAGVPRRCEQSQREIW